MKILAIDTSAKLACAALCDGKEPVALYTQNAGFTQSETALPIIESLLKNAKCSVDDIDVFACTTGPGSFTGVRIGVSLVKGLAFGKNKMCVGVSSLEALAHAVDISGAVIVPVMDARSDRLYNAIFRRDGDELVRMSPDRISTSRELSDELSSMNSDVYFVGDGYDIMKKAFPAAKDTPYQLRCANGYSVALAALEKLDRASEEEAARFTDTLLFPEYLRPSQAERNLSEKG